MPDAWMEYDHFSFFDLHVAVSRCDPDPAIQNLYLEYPIDRIVLYQRILVQAGENDGNVVRFKYSYSIPVTFIPGFFVFYLFNKSPQIHKYVGGIDHRSEERRVGKECRSV